MAGEALKAYVKMARPGEFTSQWVEWGSARHGELAERGWLIVPYDPNAENYFTMPDDARTLESVRRVERFAEKLMVASYGAGLPLQGEDVRCVVRVARLFYQEIENPTEPAAAPAAAEEEE